ncbi:MAG: bifunctional phosphopantothenoylcysteine decarboxylase/phosphopantothenate--cysteine ligase CoaBC [Gammaproteobacteria bacterium]|nr:bifunctional phosphopantothenoylcysteine decarboxylase/phosphopantothenate--cysteine ligase CoaBC [Gammaproteobacteria bacterium]MBU1732815.1 bifunctional phosphopantothenoylcysteine decarboxylase/phosphopantothenate--cysteine ligase CoaBC [Gammaproteobacteria bacterium]MBU1891640.1 bifunctional phosphopantothenoylcysteine decarboxylase/phosphopantothenate--cysteine ligase CoaBC [Gammaproteobacteria bacterium]
MINLAKKRLLLGITGGVAAYKAAELVRLLVRQNVEVQVVMTQAACQFIKPVTMQALSGRPVFTDLWDNRIDNGMAHIDFTRDIDVAVVAPASADFIAKLAHGLADDLLSTLCLARMCPLLVAPAMNRQMWENPATRRNVAQIGADGITILGPDSGAQACGETGMGRMLEAEDLMAGIEAFFQPKLLQGRHVLVTAGPTFEAIDAVRGITNSSSGKMGYAVARAAMEAGAEVTLVSGPTCLKPPAGARVVNVTTAQQMLKAVNESVNWADIFISVAAVADYYVLNPSEQKIKKDAHILTLELAPNPDIVSNVVNLPNPPFCVGFAAESENLHEYAEMKRRRKNLPLLAANLVQTAIGGDDNELVLFDDDGDHPLPRAPKITLARQLIAHIAKLYQKIQKDGKSA